MVSLNEIEKGIVKYLDNEVMPMIGNENPIQRVIIGTGVGMLLKNNFGKIEQMQQNPIIAAMGIFDKDGNVDLETLKEELKKNIPEDSGLPIELPMVGTLRFRAADVDKLYSYISSSSTHQ